MPSKLLFGKLAVRNGLARADEVEEALAVQRMVRGDGFEAPLGAILVQMGVMSRDAVRTVLAGQEFMRARWRGKAVGKMAVTKGMASEGEVEQALEAQLEAFRDDGTILEVADLLKEQGTVDGRDSARLAMVDFQPDRN